MNTRVHERSNDLDDGDDAHYTPRRDEDGCVFRVWQGPLRPPSVSLSLAFASLTSLEARVCACFRWCNLMGVFRGI